MNFIKLKIGINWKDFWNSSLVVTIAGTIIGGLFLSSSTIMWQALNNFYTQRRIETEKIYNLKKETMFELAETIPKSLNSLMAYKEKEIWLRDFSKSKNDYCKKQEKLKGCRTFKETWNKYEIDRNKYYEKYHPNSVLTKINATFSSARVIEKSNLLRDIFLSVVEKNSIDSFYEEYKKIDPIYFNLTKAMSEELFNYEK